MLNYLVERERGQRKYILLLYYPEFLELGTGTCKASASSMLREGDWSHVQDTTNVIQLITWRSRFYFSDNILNQALNKSNWRIL